MTGMMNKVFPLEVADVSSTVVLWAADTELTGAVKAALADNIHIEVLGAFPENLEPGNIALLLCRSPAEAVCRELAAGREPTAALEAWQAMAQQVLSLQRRSRSQVRIVDAEGLRREPAAFLALCGLPTESGLEQRLREAAETVVSPVLLELARSRLMADPVSRRLAGEFVAASFLSTSASVGAEVKDVALQAYLKETESLQELELMRSQQRSLYEQMEMLYGEKLQLEQRLDQMRSGLGDFEALERRLEGFKERLLAKEEALKEAGAVIARQEQVSACHAREVAALKQEAEALRSAVRRFETSRSYRLTAPLRWVRSALRGRR